jgi:hypothetical protein
MMTHIPAEALTRPPMNDSKQVTPYASYSTGAARNSSIVSGNGLIKEEKMNLVPASFVTYFLDEHTVQYAAVRIVLPSGIEFVDISHHLKYYVEADGMSLKVDMNIPPCLHEPVIVESMWMSEPIEGAYTENLRDTLLMHVKTDVLKYKTSIGLTNVSDSIIGTFTIQLSKRCETGIVVEFLRKEEKHNGCMLFLVLKCKTTIISGAVKKK